MTREKSESAVVQSKSAEKVDEKSQTTITSGFTREDDHVTFKAAEQSVPNPMEPV